MIFQDPKLRPPVLDEMMPDLQRVNATVAQRYCDTTTPHLQFDEMMGESNLKLAELVTKNKVEELPTRLEFFKFFKATVNNHARSRVQKYRFTEKRTGQKPPPREQRFLPNNKPEDDEHPEQEYHKNVDLSLDDPDLAIQVPDQHHEFTVEDDAINWGFGSTSAEYAYYLSAVEKLVFHEMIMPSAHARCYAEIDAMRRATPGKVHIKIKFSHMAEAIGLAPELFEESVLSIRKKIKAYRMLTEAQHDKEARENAIIAQLKEVFGLQIPPDIDGMVIRRMLTMAARDQFEKLNPQINEMLTEIGGKVPRSLGNDKIACYGVLYQKNCRQCNTCDLRHSCAVEAASLGLTKMTFSAKLLGARQIRVPAFLPRVAGEINAQINSADEAEIISHLNETFKKAERNNQTYYYHHVGNDRNRRYLFCIERKSPLKLRFCRPSDILKARLVGKQKTWCARDDASLSEIIALIEQHGKETFV
jgi:hypothetical protein